MFHNKILGKAGGNNKLLTHTYNQPIHKIHTLLNSNKFGEISNQFLSNFLDKVKVNSKQLSYTRNLITGKIHLLVNSISIGKANNKYYSKIQVKALA